MDQSGKKKQPIWSRLVAEHFVPTRAEAEKLVGAGLVRANGDPVLKAGAVVGSDAVITVDQTKRFVSRGGLKLERALDRFAISVVGRECVDVGSSTGGFTDLMLQRGAARVAAIDVGYGELDWKLRSDPRVVVMERTNVREVMDLPFGPSFVSIDVSFISLRIVLPVVHGWITNGGECIALVKPQFEAARAEVEEGGLVTDPAVHRSVLKKVIEESVGIGFVVRGLCVSPIRGATGNKEFLLYLWCGFGAETSSEFEVDSAVDRVLVEPVD